MKLLIAVLLFSAAVPLSGEDLPEAPSSAAKVPVSASETPAGSQNNVVFHKKVFWSLVATCGTAAVYDAQMSHSYEATHPNSHEAASWLLGRRPSLGRYYATFAVMDGGAALISYKLLHARRKPLRVLGWSLLAGLTAIHIDDDIEMATW